MYTHEIMKKLLNEHLLSRSISTFRLNEKQYTKCTKVIIATITVTLRKNGSPNYN